MQPGLSNSKTPDYRFGVDFRPVALVPEDPRDRQEYFAAFKELLKREREKIKTWHRSGAGGREVIQAHAGLIDEIIMHVVLSLASLKLYGDVPALDEFSLIAVGGYGRGELNPCSDIDLLFLLKEKVKPATDSFIQDALSILWGIGLEIGHSCRTVKDCVKLASADITIKTSLIGRRYLIGNRELSEKLGRAIETRVLKKQVKEFLNSKLKEKYSRYGLKEGVVCHPEPDIKNGPGGLRDYHVALWAVAVRFGSLAFREIGRDDVISDRELDVLERSVDFSLRVRNELHYLTSNKRDVLTLDIQDELAANLDYREENRVKPVERFMRDYFLHATNIYNFSETIFERCMQTGPSLRKTILSWQKKDLGNGFCVADSVLSAKEKAEDLFQKNKFSLLEPFALCRDRGLDLDPQLKRQIRLHKDLIDEDFLSDGRARDFLFNLLDHPRSERAFRLMRDAEVLGRILPEFGVNHCSVYYDFYHRYTSDEHSLRMVRFLEELSGNKESGLEEPARLYAETSGRRWLKLAALLHFLGRERGETAAGGQTRKVAAGGPGEEPSETGDPLSAVCRRLRIDKAGEELLRFLIDNLYEMMETAFHQDIHQPSVVEAFARKTGTVERLKLLYLISYAELRAVAPDTWTAWKKILLSEFYHRSQNFLQRPESVQEKPRDTRDEVFKLLDGEVPREEIEGHLSLMPEDYLVTAYAGEIALHLRLIRSLARKISSPLPGEGPDAGRPRNIGFTLARSYNESGGFHNLVLCCAGRSEVFKKMVGTFTAKNLNILGAQIYLRKDGLAVVAIQAEGANNVDLSDPKVWEDVEDTLRDVLESRKDLPSLLRSRTRYIENKRPLPIVPKIQIDNPQTSAYTIVRIEARDHLGMLYKIAKTLADLDIQIYRAKISCMGGRGIDVFYVTQRGGRIVNDRFIRRIKENLINVLLVEKMEDLG